MKMICDNLSVNAEGHLCLAGVDVCELAAKHGTPLYLMDEGKIREKCRIYVNAMRESFGQNALTLYASKAASFKQMYRSIMSEGMGTDLVSSGELFTAQSVGFPLEKAYFHSNNKTDADISYAIDAGVGYFVVDNVEELDSINAIACSKGKKQKILLRLTPGIDPHTYAAVATGKVDSKFGSAIETGQAEQIAKYASELDNIELCGFHCHVGSQVFDSDVFLRAGEIMLDFISLMERKYGFKTLELDLGGGYGVPYLEGDPTIDIAANIHSVAAHMKAYCEKLGISLPAIRMEPGRSIVADSGMTVYTAGTVKRIPGYKNYVSVDGGMADNPRYALYRSPYTVCLANRMNSTAPTFNCTVAGRCCESGDLIQENVTLPADITRGDIIAVLTTGAYNYSMSSNYNRLQKPPIVMVNDGKDYVAVKRESLEDVCKNDI